jgi:hypothetical protein
METNNEIDKSIYTNNLLNWGEIQCGSRVHMIPLPKKTYFEISKKKKLTKFFTYTYSQTKRVCKVPPKTDTVCGLWKQDNCHVKYLIFSTKFYLFYAHHMTRRFIVQQLCGHVASENICTNFLFQFFDI